ncbi:MAG: hypothetical protein ACXAC6_13405 [Candidatus Hodarchaeales archaeon]
MSSSEDNCVQECCNDCTASFCQSCSDSCSENCEESCGNACNTACQDSCSSVNCSCGSESTTGIITLIFTLILPLISAITLGIFQAFESQGPIFLTLLGSSILAINLSGFQINRKNVSSVCKLQENQVSSKFVSKFGKFQIKHSHHSHVLITRGHEFNLKNKYFCTGCYGILTGTIISIFLTIFYLVNGLSPSLAGWVIFISPICFIPIILRYSVKYKFPTPLRFLANALLPIGGCLLLIGMDALYTNWGLNVLIVTFIVFSAYLRGFIVRKENG